jgi:hypothetical protein
MDQRNNDGRDNGETQGGAEEIGSQESNAGIEARLARGSTPAERQENKIETILSNSDAQDQGVAGAQTPEVVPLGGTVDKAQVGVGGSNESEALLDHGSSNSRFAIVKKGETIGHILLREFGTTDPRLLAVVLKLNPELESVDDISIGQMIRLPSDSEEPGVE